MSSVVDELVAAIARRGFTEWRPKNYGAPSAPGCYFVGVREGDRVVPKYVGKAKVLLSRVRYHVTKRHPIEIHSCFVRTSTPAVARDLEKRFQREFRDALPWNINKGPKRTRRPPRTL